MLSRIINLRVGPRVCRGSALAFECLEVRALLTAGSWHGSIEFLGPDPEQQSGSGYESQGRTGGLSLEALRKSDFLENPEEPKAEIGEGELGEGEFVPADVGTGALGLADRNVPDRTGTDSDQSTISVAAIEGTTSEVEQSSLLVQLARGAHPRSPEPSLQSSLESRLSQPADRDQLSESLLTILAHRESVSELELATAVREQTQDCCNDTDLFGDELFVGVAELMEADLSSQSLMRSVESFTDHRTNLKRTGETTAAADSNHSPSRPNRAEQAMEVYVLRTDEVAGSQSVDGQSTTENTNLIALTHSEAESIPSEAEYLRNSRCDLIKTNGNAVMYQAFELADRIQTDSGND